MWEKNGLIVIAFGHGGLRPPPPSSTCIVVLAKWFLYDATYGELGEVAFVGLIQSLVAMEGVSLDMAAMCSVLSKPSRECIKPSST